MPLIRYACECGFERKSLKKPPIPATIPCEKCEKAMKRQLSGPALSSTVSIDNGLQSRAIDVNLEVVESNKENSKKDFREK